MQMSWTAQVWMSLLVLAAVLESAQEVLGVVIQPRTPPPPIALAESGNCSVALESVPSLTLLMPTAHPPSYATPIPSITTPTHPPALPTHSTPSPTTPTHSSASLTTPTRAAYHGTTTDMLFSLALANITANETPRYTPSWESRGRTSVAPRLATLATAPTTSLPFTTLVRPTLPPSTTQPTPSTPRRQPTHKLVELEKELTSLIEGQVASTLDEEMAALMRRPYLERMRFTNHEMVDRVLQELPGRPQRCLLDLHQQRLHDLRRKLTLLLLSLPQSLSELQEGSQNDEVENYVFRPQEKNILDVNECRHCYSKDALGRCRELFFCKRGSAVGAIPRPSREELMRIYHG